jgi:hypothetical protein
MSDTDLRWQEYHGKLRQLMDDESLEDFHKHPVIVRAVTGGECDYLKHTKGYEAEFVRAFNTYTESPDLLPDARKKHDKMLHVASEKYIMQACLFLRHFPNVNGREILEVGGGYGGFCRVLTSVCPRISGYTFLDHQAMIHLVRHFLRDRMDKVTTVTLEDKESVTLNTYDLFISNYCLSETPPEFQMWVAREIFPRCCGVFIIDGDGKKPEFKKMLLKNLRKVFSKVEVLSYPVYPCEVFVGKHA